MHGLMPPESYHTYYYVNYVPKSLMYPDDILVFQCWIGSSEFIRRAVFCIAGCLYFTLVLFALKACQATGATRHTHVLVRESWVQYPTETQQTERILDTRSLPKNLFATN